MVPLLALALAAAGLPPWRLTPDGLGPVRIGMTERAAAHAIGQRIDDISSGDADDDAACHMATAARLPGATLMFEDGRLTRITLDKPGFRTADGFGVGASEKALRAFYGARVEVAPAEYDDEARSLRLWDRSRRRGLRYLTDPDRRTTTIHAGTASIDYIENCL